MRTAARSLRPRQYPVARHAPAAPVEWLPRARARISASASASIRATAPNPHGELGRLRTTSFRPAIGISYIVRRHGDVTPASLRKDANHPVGIGKSKGSGRERLSRRLGWQQVTDGSQRHLKPGVLRQGDARQRTVADRPGASLCRRLAKAATGSAKNMTPKRENSRSTAGSVTVLASATRISAFVRPAAAIRSRARVVIGCDTSRPKTWPVGPTRRASSSVVAPQPQPVSRTCSPAAGAAARRAMAVSGSNTASRRSCATPSSSCPRYRSNRQSGPRCWWHPDLRLA